MTVRDDVADLTRMVAEFFAAFTSDTETDDRLDRLPDLFLPGARIVRTGGEPLASYDVDAFIAPRRALLTGGSLVDFAEQATNGRLDVFGDIAAWFGSYVKQGRLDGQPYGGAGMKSIQFVRTGAGWKIAGAVWDDERTGLSGADHLSTTTQGL